MRLPIVSLISATTRQKIGDLMATPDQSALMRLSMVCMVSAMDKFRTSRLFWARAVGPSLTKLFEHLAKMNDEGISCDHISTFSDVEKAFFLKDFGGEMTPEAMLKRREERTPDWAKAWEKICGFWVVPPELTPAEIAHIESLACEILEAFAAPVNPRPKVFDRTLPHNA